MAIGLFHLLGLKRPQGKYKESRWKRHMATFHLLFYGPSEARPSVVRRSWSSASLCLALYWPRKKHKMRWCWCPKNRHFSKFPNSHSKSSRFYLFLTRVGANQFPAFFDQAKLDYDKVFPAKTVLRALRREEQSWQERPSHTTITLARKTVLAGKAAPHTTITPSAAKYSPYCEQNKTV